MARTADELLKEIKDAIRVDLTDQQESIIFGVIGRELADRVDEARNLEGDLQIAQKSNDRMEALHADTQVYVDQFFDAAGGAKLFGAFETGRDPYKLAIEAVKKMTPPFDDVGLGREWIARRLEGNLQDRGLHALSDQHMEVLVEVFASTIAESQRVSTLLLDERQKHEIEKPRHGAFIAFAAERMYQDLKYGPLDEQKPAVATLLLCMNYALNQAKFFSVKGDDHAMLREVVQVGAVATAILEMAKNAPGRTTMEIDRAHRRADARARARPAAE